MICQKAWPSPEEFFKQKKQEYLANPIILKNHNPKKCMFEKYYISSKLFPLPPKPPKNTFLKENKELIFFIWAFSLLANIIYKKCLIKK